MSASLRRPALAHRDCDGAQTGCRAKASLPRLAACKRASLRRSMRRAATSQQTRGARLFLAENVAAPTRSHRPGPPRRQTPLASASRRAIGIDAPYHIEARLDDRSKERATTRRIPAGRDDEEPARDASAMGLGDGTRRCVSTLRPGNASLGCAPAMRVAAPPRRRSLAPARLPEQLHERRGKARVEAALPRLGERTQRVEHA